MCAGTAGAPEQLGNAQRGALGVVLRLDAIPAAFLAHMFAQQLAGFGFEQADKHVVPLHAHHAPDPGPSARRSTRLQLQRSRPDARCVRRTGNGGRVPAAVEAGTVSLRQTSPRLGVWWRRKCACRPSALPQRSRSAWASSRLSKRRHTLLDDLADATLDGTRKENMEFLVIVPLPIIDDLGMPKLPLTAAEELLEIIMRRYERAGTMLTSNRRSKTGASCWARRPPSAPCSTAYCTTDTCSSAVRGAGEPRPTCHHKRRQGRTI
jgi:hypothetical protein